MENLYVRVYGKLIPISSLSFLQLSPKGEVIYELPLSWPIQKLMRFHESLGPVGADYTSWITENGGNQ